MFYTVLLVDDCEYTRKSISYVLKKLGFGIDEAADGYEALSKIESSKIDIIISDNNMPNLSGIELLNIIKSNPLNADIPVIIISSENNKKFEELAIQLGAKTTLTKPVNTEQLISVMSKMGYYSEEII